MSTPKAFLIPVRLYTQGLADLDVELTEGLRGKVQRETLWWTREEVKNVLHTAVKVGSREGVHT